MGATDSVTAGGGIRTAAASGLARTVPARAELGLYAVHHRAAGGLPAHGVGRDSRQHSLWTWLIWLGAHLTMAAWMYEHDSQRVDAAIGVSLANAAACGLTTALTRA